MPVLSIDRVAFDYAGSPVLDGVSLAIEEGEQVAIVGANGAGKTTLLKLMAGLLRPRAGSIRLGGREASRVPAGERARIIGFVPQEFAAPFSWTVRALVECGRTAHVRWFRSLSAADQEAVDEALASTGSLAYADRLLEELSGGERQRAAIAVALAQQPDILLLDEPTQHLDLARQGEILDLVSDLRARGPLTIVATMHDLNVAAMYFDRLIVVADGAVRADGPPARVLRADVLEPAYGGALAFLDVPDRPAPVVLPARRMTDEGGRARPGGRLR